RAARAGSGDEDGLAAAVRSRVPRRGAGRRPPQFAGRSAVSAARAGDDARVRAPSTPAGCRAGIIAAGRGERLRMPGGEPKPLVPIAGRPLIDRVLASLAEVDPAQV